MIQFGSLGFLQENVCDPQSQGACSPSLEQRDPGRCADPVRLWRGGRTQSHKTESFIACFSGDGSLPFHPGPVSDLRWARTARPGRALSNQLRQTLPLLGLPIEIELVTWPLCHFVLHTIA
ncbi:hypothetical protein HJG60_011872 [Phyllostomus discolor]|uniref:Uncharacterized protein n=1 Tax=Phyllostomus discolor TaxID=89673 RepID=A0A833ZNW6_9CHIR|nr:hypothetical protein HJG60_011872 [Phyllostomus discolor]